VLLAGGALAQRWYADQVVASAVLVEVASGQAAPTTLTVRRSGATELALRGLADPPAGHVYEVWMLPPGQAPRPVGVAAHGDQTLRIPDPAPGASVAVTLEPAPGSAAPTLPLLLAGVVERGQ
jgi:anti-sigma-K factor RskA